MCRSSLCQTETKHEADHVTVVFQAPTGCDVLGMRCVTLCFCYSGFSDDELQFFHSFGIPFGACMHSQLVAEQVCTLVRESLQRCAPPLPVPQFVDNVEEGVMVAQAAGAARIGVVRREQVQEGNDGDGDSDRAFEDDDDEQHDRPLLGRVRRDIDL